MSDKLAVSPDVNKLQVAEVVEIHRVESQAVPINLIFMSEELKPTA